MLQRTDPAVEVDTEVNPAGAKGIGELANIGTAAAVANAVFHATRRRTREMPIKIDKLITGRAQSGVVREFPCACDAWWFFGPRRER